MASNVEYKQLIQKIREWNANRLDLFEISYPNEKLEFYGVIRFFYQGEDLKYQSKCVRVSNRNTTAYLVSVLIQKFHPDMRMLTVDKYGLYENHTSGPDRQLGDQEIPLLIQLNWAMDDREGKFILKNESKSRASANMDVFGFNARASTTTEIPLPSLKKDKRSHSASDLSASRTSISQPEDAGVNDSFGFKRRWSSSKRKRRKQIAAQEQAIADAKRRADELAGKPPDSSFTRTLSNSELVMKRKRQQKLESRMQQFSTSNGSSETGGTLKIFGDKIDKKVPYKTLLLSANDTAESVVRQTIEKYGIDGRLSWQYCLIQVHTDSSNDARSGTRVVSYYRLRDNDCPLGILLFDPPSRGNYVFQLEEKSDKVPPFRPRPVPPGSTTASVLAHHQKPSMSPMTPVPTKVDPQYNTFIHPALLNRPPSRTELVGSQNNSLRKSPNAAGNVPFLVEVRDDGSEKVPRRVHRLTSLIPPSVSSRRSVPIRIGSSLQAVGQPPGIVLSGPAVGLQDIWPMHCVIQRTNGGEGPLEIVPTISESSQNRHVRAYASVSVNQMLILKATELLDGHIVSLGSSGMQQFRLHDPFSPESHHFTPTQQMPKNTGAVELRAKPPRSAPPVGPKTPYYDLPQFSNDRLVMDAPSSPLSYLPVIVEYTTSQEATLIATLLDNAKLPDSLLRITSSGSFGLQPASDFPLIPAYCLYCLLRAALMDPNDVPASGSQKMNPRKESRLRLLLSKISQKFLTVIESKAGDVAALAFWMANANELLHFVKCDEELHLLRALEPSIAEIASAVGQAFHSLQLCIQEDMEVCIGSFFNPQWTPEDDALTTEKGEVRVPIRLTQYFHLTMDEASNSQLGSCGHLLGVLSMTVTVLRHCRVNAALTIQLYSQIFHWINQRLFNQLINSVQKGLQGKPRRSLYMNNNMLSEEVCEKLQHRLRCVKAWALRQGLELAAENHLQRIDQACELVMMDKQKEIERLYSDVTSLSALNSVQVGFVLYNTSDKHLPDDWIEVIVSGVREVADRAHQEESGSTELELLEDTELPLPLLLPDDGYSAELEIVNSVPTVYSQMHHLYQRGLISKCLKNNNPDARWSAYLNVYENTGPTSRSIISMGSFRGSGRGISRDKPMPVQPVATNGHYSILQQLPSPKHPPSTPLTLTSKNVPSSPSSPGSQAVVFSPPPTAIIPSKKNNPNIIQIQVKKVNKSLGLRIVSAKSDQGPGEGLGVYISEIVANGGADQDGRLSVGDQILQVDNISLVDADNAEALRAMGLTGERVNLRIEKNAAKRKGLYDVVMNHLNAKEKIKQNANASQPPSKRRDSQQPQERRVQQSPISDKGHTGARPMPVRKPAESISSRSSAIPPSSASTTTDLRNLVWTETDLDSRRMRKFRPMAAVVSPTGNTKRDQPTTAANRRPPEQSPSAQYAVPIKPSKRPQQPIKTNVRTINRERPSPNYPERSSDTIPKAPNEKLAQMEKELADLEDRPKLTLSPLERENLSRLRVAIDAEKRQSSLGSRGASLRSPFSSSSSSSGTEETSTSSTSSEDHTLSGYDVARSRQDHPVNSSVPRLKLNLDSPVESPRQSLQPIVRTSNNNQLQKLPAGNKDAFTNPSRSPLDRSSADFTGERPKYAWRPPPPPPNLRSMNSPPDEIRLQQPLRNSAHY